MWTSEQASPHPPQLSGSVFVLTVQPMVEMFPVQFAQPAVQV
jgi:hypothetical protein